MTLDDTTIRTAFAASGLPEVTVMAGSADRILHSEVYGAGPPAGAARVYRLASMTKPIVSVAILRVVDAGKLSLDAPVRDLIPEVAHPSILTGFDAAGDPLLRPAATALTLRMLLTHSAGYGNNFFSPAFARYLERTGKPRRAESPDQLRDLPLLFEPGTGWAYGGTNTDLAGLAAARATGRPLAQIVQDEVTGPLGMTDTSFLPGPDQVAALADMFDRQPDGSLTPVIDTVPDRLPLIYGAGGLYSTAPDCMAFLQAMLGGRLLSPAMQAEFVRPQLAASADIGRLVSNNPISLDCDLFDGAPASWSLGCLVNTQPTPQGRSPFSHYWAGIHNTHFWLDFTRGICGLVMAQLKPFCDPAVMSIVNSYETMINRRFAAG